MTVLLVAVGGGLGAVSRYLLGNLIKTRTKERRIPTAMLIVNILGAFGLGLFFGWVYREVPSMVYDDLRYLFIGVGFFGAFTTFSTFSIETSTLIRKKKWRDCALYVGSSIIGSIMCFVLAMLITAG
ncbi:fluoride efflux transporter CrcB [Salipaludibacillus agaradhaerens]|jgi:CrcB protein|uniref:fluoride efflux transporter CrcB n=1 Tax=Salipaludibacillus agaradhaerens TaxID=76935 RepID=UPI002151A7C5|nr:fluoride efflux transporter CrcB [Salipaludibacillus agaradhaerens]MCR6105304.1 fluoride efflux transporter CrcB [Salipaludibacillus agaradhaerens]MCR6117345.1 fluoride efflux transporter CrcB [Salipaludibacillus agaradhaerens]UJW56546.1 fluoride efflux transporter CrcB [Bacillus sp. A116_S68]